MNGCDLILPSVALPAGVLADFVSTGLGVLGLAWQSSPAVTEVEEVTTDWVRRMVGLSEAWNRQVGVGTGAPRGSSRRSADAANARGPA
jgi:hypothetical protein